MHIQQDSRWGIRPAARDVALLRALVDSTSIRIAARHCVVSPNTVVRVLASQNVHQSTLALVRARLTEAVQ